METSEVLYTRCFSDFGSLQSAHVLQYAVVTDSSRAPCYGVSVITLQTTGKEEKTCPAICGTREQACRLLLFLWENAVSPQAMPGIIEDIRRMGLAGCLGAEK